ncbi:MAG TPA: helix-turn-helix domain-containing protein, partial [bacterium]|nr:helix-turn-helix domain-containing protein [bacterium]
AYHWPGNVRELRNIIERVMILEDAKVIKLSFLPENLQRLASSHPAAAPAGPPPGPTTTTAFPSLDAVEKAHILRALEMTGQNVSRAADLLGISRHTVLRKLERYGRAPRDGDGARASDIDAD